MPEIELFTADSSPYAQRVRMALLEKGIGYWHTEIDLANKPEWFLVISPTGEVPVIRHEDHFVADPTVILEYLEDVFPSPRLRPADPALRAVARFWTKIADEKLYPAMLRVLLSTGEKRSAAWTKLRDLLMFIEREGLTRCGRGPYWLGQELSVVDLVYYPFFERLPALPEAEGTGLPLLSIRLRYWLNAMGERPSVQATRNSLETHARAFAGFSGVRQPRRRDGNIEYLYA